MLKTVIAQPTEKARLSISDLKQSARRFVAWRERIDPKGKPRKVPYDPNHVTAAKPNDSSTWGTFSQATVRSRHLLKNGGKGGVGLMLGDLGNGSHLAGVDLDSCLDEADFLEPWAAEVVDRFEAYTEISPSGRGVKLFFLISDRDLPRLRAAMGGDGGREFSRGNHCEIALTVANRYFALTGQELAKNDAQLELVGPDDRLRTVPLATLLWLVQEAGPAFARMDDTTSDTISAQGKTGDTSNSAAAFNAFLSAAREGLTFEEAQEAVSDEEGQAAEWIAYASSREIERTWARAEAKAASQIGRIDPNTAFTDDDVEPEAAAHDATNLFVPVSTWAAQEAPEREWLVKDLIPASTVTMLGGDGGTGKSLLALGLAVSTASSGRWIGRKIDMPGKVMFLSAEDDRDELHRRLGDICRSQKVDMAGLDNLLIRSLAGEDALLASLDRKTNALKRTALYEALDRAMEAERPSLLVLDTLADLHAGEENQRAHARQFIGLLRHLAIRHECAIVLLAHPSLTGMSNGSGLSGSTAWNASVRSRLYLDRVKNDEGNEIDPSARVLRVMKSNYGPTGTEIVIRWEQGVFTGRTEDFSEGEPLGETAGERAERVFLKLLDETTDQERHVSHKASNTYAPKQFSKRRGNEGVTQRAFEIAMESLFASGTIRVGKHKSGGHDRNHIERSPGAESDFPQDVIDLLGFVPTVGRE